MSSPSNSRSNWTGPSLIKELEYRQNPPRQTQSDLVQLRMKPAVGPHREAVHLGSGIHFTPRRGSGSGGFEFIACANIAVLKGDAKAHSGEIGK
jgi:hypothetical protein